MLGHAEVQRGAEVRRKWKKVPTIWGETLRDYDSAMPFMVTHFHTGPGLSRGRKSYLAQFFYFIFEFLQLLLVLCLLVFLHIVPCIFDNMILLLPVSKKKTVLCSWPPLCERSEPRESL